jgi:hypothetical protein
MNRLIGVIPTAFVDTVFSAIEEEDTVGIETERPFLPLLVKKGGGITRRWW